MTLPNNPLFRRDRALWCDCPGCTTHVRASNHRRTRLLVAGAASLIALLILLPRLV